MYKVYLQIRHKRNILQMFYLPEDESKFIVPLDRSLIVSLRMIFMTHVHIFHVSM